MRRYGMVLGLLAVGLAGSSLGVGPADAAPVSVVPGDVSEHYGPPSVDLGVQVPGSPGGAEPSPGGHNGGSSGSGPAYPDLTFPGNLSRICHQPAPGWLCPQPGAPGAPEAPGGPQPAGLAAQAAEQLVLPEPVSRHSPDVALPDGRRATLVGEHTWFWTEPNEWRPQTERVQVGPVWAEVTARPVRLAMQPGLGEPTASCAGPGTPYERSVPAHAASPDCDVVYQHSSAAQPGEQAQAEWQIQWQVTWRGGTGPEASDGGQLPAMTSRSTDSFAVAEAQALHTR